MKTQSKCFDMFNKAFEWFYDNTGRLINGNKSIAPAELKAFR